MEPVTFEVSPGITAIDTFYGGRERYTAAYLLAADRPTLVETGPTTSVEPVVAGLERLGVGPHDLANIVVTHIHLDHAGGVGRLRERFPAATVFVHERGARHLADPARLVASATRLYGETQMAALFGPVDPVPAERIAALADGDRIELGGRALLVDHTPGHASHQVALTDTATGAVFTGDALGVHVPDLPVLRPATPPPDVDVEAAVESIERIRTRARSVLLFAHFGPIPEIDRTCDLAIARIRAWAEAVRDELRRTDDPDEIADRLREEARRDIETGAEASLDLDALENRLRLLSSVRMNALGLIRYWQKRGVDGDELIGGRDGSVAADRAGRERDPGPAAPQPS
jgi:glyoxylase-like metal-dependent hydrolase (beta-lactamase superfamily II)